MSAFTFTKAVKSQEKLRLALDGPAGGGKTWTALTIATYLAKKDGGRIAVIDSERSSAKKYANDFDFDHGTLPDFEPETYTGAIKAAIAAGYSVVIVDSLTHAWEGVLERKDDVTARSQSKNSFDAWRTVTPIHNELVDTLLRAPCHVIATLRTKTEYVIEVDERTGKSKPRKIGMKPIQRDGTEYEFDVVGDLDQENTLTVSKSRCSALSGAVIRRPGEEMAETLWLWLTDGEEVVTSAQAAELVAAMDSMPAGPARGEAKQAFVARFGRPESLLASQLEEAAAWVAEKVSAEQPAPAAAEPGAAGEGTSLPPTSAPPTEPRAPEEPPGDPAAVSPGQDPTPPVPGAAPERLCHACGGPILPEQPIRKVLNVDAYQHKTCPTPGDQGPPPPGGGQPNPSDPADDTSREPERTLESGEASGDGAPVVGGLPPAAVSEEGDGAAPSTAGAVPASKDPGQRGTNHRHIQALCVDVFGQHGPMLTERRRHWLAGQVTGGRSESTNDLTVAEQEEMIGILRRIKEGSLEPHRRATGEWELRVVPGSRAVA